MVSKNRLSRIEERLKEDLSEILLMKTSDPRLEGLTITDVKVDRELAYADIFVCTIEGSERASEIINGLEHAQGYLRSELAHRMDLRVFPRLRFHWDPTLEKADKIDRLISELHQTEVGDEKEVKKRKMGKKNESQS